MERSFYLGKVYLRLLVVMGLAGLVVGLVP